MLRPKRGCSVLFALLLTLPAARFAFAADASKSDDKADDAAAAEPFKPHESTTEGSIFGLPYQAVAGTLVVHPRGWDDVRDKANKDNPTAEASMFYAAYFKKSPPGTNRPLTFLYNGGPGSSSVWLHLGAFGPKRVLIANDRHVPMAPYRMVDNDSTLLDVSDLVFIDAPATGFSRVAGKDKEKSFFGVDQDGYAFAQFIQQFLTKYGRWNSPKYLFGESYGTTRSAVLINLLETEEGVDFNGVVLLSQCFNFGLGPDGPESNPGVDLPYELALPTFAATAWYHHKLSGSPPADLQGFLHEVESFAMGDYATALQAGSTLPSGRRRAIAEKLHAYTGLRVDYILKADLRISGGEFEKGLQDEANLTIGRIDTRFSGPHMDPLSKEADYDPLISAIESAYLSAFNDYARKTLKYGEDEEYHPFATVIDHWDDVHREPGMPSSRPVTLNVMPDMAMALKYNPNLKVLLLGGYFDLATPYFQGLYEMHHLAIPPELQANISYRYYPSGHMVYANPEALKDMHGRVADFIRATDNLKGD